MGKLFKKFMTVLIVTTIIASVLSGCGENASTVDDGIFNFSMMSIYYSAEPPRANDPVLKEIEKHTNTKIDIAWVPSAAYQDKIAVTIASGDMPQALLVTNIGNQSIINGAKSGMFWDIDSYLDEFPNLSTKLNPNVVESIKIDGKLYGIYRTRPIARDAVIYRKDWLDNLGMEEPATIDEVYEMFRAFTFDDPDQNGVDDTLGLAEMKNLPYGVMIASWFGSPTQWREDGTPDFMTDEYLEMLKFYKRLYDEGIINQDFAVAEEAQVQQLFLSGKAGAKLHVWDALLRDEESTLKEIDPNAEISGFSLIEGPKGINVRSWGGHGGMFMFPKSSVKAEEELKKLLNYFDKMYDLPMQNLMRHGIEGVHYKVEDGKAFRIVDKIDDTTFSVMDQMFINYDEAMEPGGLTEGGNKAVRMLKEARDYVVYNPFAGLISQTNNERGAQLVTIIDDAKIQFVMGAIDEAGWRSEIERWRANGGDKVIEELKTEFEKRNN